MYYKTTYDSIVGELTLISDGENLTALLFEREKYHEEMGKAAQEKGDLPVFHTVKEWLDRYFAEKKPEITDLPLAPAGSAFQHSVWEILKKIPYGKIVTYGEIAREIAMQQGKEKMSAQAVGGAVGHNPVSIIIPCHRVVGANGSLTGFGGGIDAKKKLLEHEEVNMSKLFVPTKGTAL